MSNSYLSRNGPSWRVSAETSTTKAAVEAIFLTLVCTPLESWWVSVRCCAQRTSTLVQNEETTYTLRASAEALKALYPITVLSMGCLGAHRCEE